MLLILKGLYPMNSKLSNKKTLLNILGVGILLLLFIIIVAVFMAETNDETYADSFNSKINNIKNNIPKIELNNFAECASKESLKNIQDVSPSVIELFGTFELPSNYIQIMHDFSLTPEYDNRQRICFAEVYTSAGEAFIIFKTFLREGVGGERMFIEVQELNVVHLIHINELASRLKEKAASNSNLEKNKEKSISNNESIEENFEYFEIIPESIENKINSEYKQIFDNCMELAFSNVEQNNCISADIDKWDDRLNIAYKKLQNKLSGEDFNKLRQIQRRWIEFINTECDENQWEGSQAARLTTSCKKSFTAMRALELEDYLN